MKALIQYESDGYKVSHGKPMGRHFAGRGFLTACARHASDGPLTGLVRNRALGEEFCTTVRQLQPGRSCEFVLPGEAAAALRRTGCLYTPGPIDASLAWQRNLHGPAAWSVCGVNHTLSSARAMDAVTDLLTAPVQPWDALICTSNASRQVILRLLERQAEYLSQRLGATRFVTPQLPVIPLGVDCEAQARRAGTKPAARAALGIQDGEIAVLFLGRLSFHAKANPAPMYMALEQLALRHRVVLVECGWSANEHIAQAFADARARLCPSVRSIALDGRETAAQAASWASADIFCSLSDNIQETFGLTPIEAMAAGLPVVVSDWDGYRDTVRDGIDGFAVPTLAAPRGAGHSLALRHAQELDSYDVYLGRTAGAIVVDVGATAAALDRLASDPELRRRMGANGMARAREVFDWRVVMKAYESLWEHLGHMRAEAAASPSPSPPPGRRWPARPDPFELFAGFPSAALTAQHRVTRAPGVDGTEVTARLSLKLASMETSTDLTPGHLLDLWERIGPAVVTVEEIVAACRPVPGSLTARAILRLAKLDLVRVFRQEPS